MLNSSIFILVPTFNEAPALRRTLAPLVSAGYRVAVIDDGSTDDTATVLARLPVTIIRHAVNLGQGAALQTGMDYARRHGAFVAVHFDADGQHSWQQIPDLVQPIVLGRADIVLGSRFLRPEYNVEIPLARSILLRIGILVSAIFTRLWLSDTHNGFRALSPKALNEIQLQQDGFAHATEILAEIRRCNLRYVEVPTAIRYSDYSREKGQRFWSSFNIVIDLLLEQLFR